MNDHDAANIGGGLLIAALSLLMIVLRYRYNRRDQDAADLQSQ